MTIDTNRIFWQGHDSFRIEGRQIIYIDPWEVTGPLANIILITHEHFDHCDPDTVKALIGPTTKIITEPAAAEKLKEAGLADIVTVAEPGDEVEVLGVNIKIVPAYNIGKDFHPKARRFLGFVVNMDGLSVYHAGDTDFIPEMNDIRVQVALLPVSGTYTMNAEEAVQAALAIKPEVVMPMHYAKIVGGLDDAEKLQAGLKGQIKVVLKKQSTG